MRSLTQRKHGLGRGGVGGGVGAVKRHLEKKTGNRAVKGALQFQLRHLSFNVGGERKDQS